VHDHGRDSQQRQLHVRHVNTPNVNVDTGHVNAALVVDASLPQHVGHTDDLDRRIGEHQHGLIVGYTSKRRPVILLWSQDFPTREEALAAELQIKHWSHAKKEALVSGDWTSLQAAAKKRFR